MDKQFDRKHESDDQEESSDVAERGQLKEIAQAPLQQETREQRERERMIREVVDRGACAISTYFTNEILEPGKHNGSGAGWDARVSERGARWKEHTWKTLSPTSLYPFDREIGKATESELRRLRLFGSLGSFRLWTAEARQNPGGRERQGAIPIDFFQQHPIREYVQCSIPAYQMYKEEVYEEARTVKRAIETKALFGLIRRRTEVEEQEVVPVTKTVPTGTWVRHDARSFIGGISEGEGKEDVVRIYYHAEAVSRERQLLNEDEVGRPYSFLETRFFLPQSLFKKFFPQLQKDPTIIRDITRLFFEQMTSQKDPMKITRALPRYDAWDADPKAVHGMYILGPDEDRPGKVGEWDDFDERHVYPVSRDKE